MCTSNVDSADRKKCGQKTSDVEIREVSGGMENAGRSKEIGKIQKSCIFYTRKGGSAQESACCLAHASARYACMHTVSGMIGK